MILGPVVGVDRLAASSVQALFCPEALTSCFQALQFWACDDVITTQTSLFDTGHLNSGQEWEAIVF